MCSVLSAQFLLVSKRMLGTACEVDEKDVGCRVLHYSCVIDSKVHLAASLERSD